MYSYTKIIKKLNILIMGKLLFLLVELTLFWLKNMIKKIKI